MVFELYSGEFCYLTEFFTQLNSVHHIRLTCLLFVLLLIVEVKVVMKMFHFIGEFFSFPHVYMLNVFTYSLWQKFPF